MQLRFVACFARVGILYSKPVASRQVLVSVSEPGFPFYSILLTVALFLCSYVVSMTRIIILKIPETYSWSNYLSNLRRYFYKNSSLVGIYQGGHEWLFFSIQYEELSISYVRAHLKRALVALSGIPNQSKAFQSFGSHEAHIRPRGWH